MNPSRPRALRWRDLPLLYRYRRQSVDLRMMYHVLGGPGLLSIGWLAALSSGGGVAAAVDEQPPKPIIGVAEVNLDSALLEMLYLAPKALLAEASLSPLIEHLLTMPNTRGMRAVTAEAPLDAPWLEQLREAGFQIVERRQIWRLPAPQQRPTGSDKPWHYPTPETRWMAERLYRNLTPPLVRLARPNPALSPTALVYLERGHVRGVAHWSANGYKVWVEPLLNPDIHEPTQALGALVAALPAGTIFFSLPDSQAWLGQALTELGAQALEPYASLVRWSAKTVEEREALLAEAEAVVGAVPPPP